MYMGEFATVFIRQILLCTLTAYVGGVIRAFCPPPSFHSLHRVVALARFLHRP